MGGVCAVVGTFFIAGGVVATAAGHGIGNLVNVVAELGFLFIGLDIWLARVRVGADGVRVERLFRKQFIPRNDIADVELGVASGMYIAGQRTVPHTAPTASDSDTSVPVRMLVGMPVTTSPDLATLLPDWRMNLAAHNVAPSTIASYLKVGDNLMVWLRTESRPSQLDAVDRRKLEAFLAPLGERVSPATVAKHYRNLQ